MRKLLVRVLAATAALALAWSLVVWLTGGLDFTIAGLHVTSTNISRLLVAGLAAAVVALLVNGFRSTVEDVKTTAARVTPFSVAVALAATTTVLSLLASSWTASGPDSYAYLSHAAMLREGRLSVPIDLADEAPWPGAPGTFVPFGYHLTASRPSALVPVTAPGLPMLMAALQLVAGHCAAFLVTPVAGGALVWLTFLIGRRVRSPAAGLIAAWLVATSPAVLFMLMWPMSDIPGAAWTALVLLWLIPGGFAPADPPTPASAFGFGEASPKRASREGGRSLAGALDAPLPPPLFKLRRGSPKRLRREGGRSRGLTRMRSFAPLPARDVAAFGAGLAASAGVLTRTTVGAIAVAAGVWLMLEAIRTGRESRRWSRSILFGLGLIPGLALTAWLNNLWHGSPLASGYGATDELFSLSRVGTNAALYLTWLAETSPLGLVGLAALAWPSRRIWSPVDGSRADRGLGNQSALRNQSALGFVTVAAVAAYLTYFSYEQWWYLRFLLPAWPAIFVATAVACDAIRERGRVPAIVTLAVIVIAGIAGVRTAYARGVFQIGNEERRYVTVARLVQDSTEPDAVILTSQHAGTLRYYAGRETVRFDLLDPAWLDRAVGWLAERGRQPYILIEDWEVPLFTARFGRSNALGDLSFTPAVAWQSARVRGWVFLYDPLRRERKTARPGPEIEQHQPMCAPPVRPRVSFSVR